MEQLAQEHNYLMDRKKSEWVSLPDDWQIQRAA
jgi:hypothetical protein